MNPTTFSRDVVDAVRDGDWARLSGLLDLREVVGAVPVPSDSIFSWMIELNAPSAVLVRLLRFLVEIRSIDPNRQGILEKCLDLSETCSNAFDTFEAMLDHGLDANGFVSDGNTLFQHALGRNRVREVKALLHHGARAEMMNLFGRESTSNVQEATIAGNAAGRAAIQYWSK
jgi:hypothetical protein